MAAKPAAPRPPAGEVGWSGSLLSRLMGQAKYNPDNLIGRRGPAIYEQMLLDEQVQAAVLFKRDAVVSRGITWELETDELDDAEKERRIGLYEHIVAEMDGTLIDGINAVLQGVWQGYSMTEIVYREVEFEGRSWVGLQGLFPKPAASFTFVVDEHGQLEEIVQELGGRRQTIEPERFIHYVHNPDRDRHYGRSELRAAHRPWMAKDVIITLRNIWLERVASGATWIQPKEGHTLERGSREWNDLVDVLERMQSHSTWILPGTVEIKRDYPPQTPGYEEAINADDRRIARALMMPNLLGLTEAGQTGTFAQSKVQLEAFLWTLQALAERLADTLNEQLWRRLGRYNFPDRHFPRMVMRPASDELIERIVRVWLDAVRSGSATATDTDEEHVRDLLRFPAAGNPLKKPAGVSPPQPFPAGGDEEGRVGAPEVDGEGRDLLPPGASPPGLSPQAEKGGERRARHIAGFTAALGRVDFAAIEGAADRTEERALREAGGALAEGIRALAGRVVTERLGTAAGDIEAAGTLEIAPRHKRALRKAFRDALAQAWQSGQGAIAREIVAAKGGAGPHPSPPPPGGQENTFAALEDKAAAFLDARSFQMAGKLSGDALAIVQNILAQAIKAGTPTPEIEAEIYRQLATKGFLGREAAQALADGLTGPAKEALAEALGTAAVDARLRTAIRTNLSEAINEARYSFASDPALGGFVEALEYSAILDGRTSEICEELDGKVYPVDSPEWDRFRPPNHFNCRSLLIPVTVRDEWAESDSPKVDPQDGFDAP